MPPVLQWEGKKIYCAKVIVVFVLCSMDDDQGRRK